MQLADGTQIVRSPRSDTAMQQPAHLRHTQRTAQTASETGTAEEASETLSDPGASGELLASSRPMGLGGHALLLLALLSGSAVGLLFFSLLGYGVEVYRALASVDWWLAPSLVVGALLLLVALYALDARYWKGAGRIAAYFHCSPPLPDRSAPPACSAQSSIRTRRCCASSSCRRWACGCCAAPPCPPSRRAPSSSPSPPSCSSSPWR